LGTAFISHIFSSARSERAMMVFGCIRQMLSLRPEDVNKGRAFRMGGFRENKAGALSGGRVGRRSEKVLRYPAFL